MKSESRSTPKVSAVSFIHFLSWLVFLILCWVFSIFRASCTRVFNLSNIASSIDSSGILLSSRTHKHFKCELTVIMQQSPRPRLPRSAFTTRLSSGADMSMLNPFCIARAVRPFLWIYVSADRGIWKWTTWSTAVISRPRAAISVARRTEFGVCVNLEFREDDEMKSPGFESYKKVLLHITHLSRFFSRWRCSNWECSGKALILSSSTSGMSLRMPSIDDRKTSDLPGYLSKK